MKKVDYIIVGDGFAGLFFAHQLLMNSKSFILFGGKGLSASRVSAGMINPVVLKKFTSFWLSQEQIDFLKSTMQEMVEYLGINCLIEQQIHRIFHDETEKKVWMKKAKTEALAPFLSSDFVHLPVVKNESDSGRVLQSMRVDVDVFFSSMIAYLVNKGHCILEPFDYNVLQGQQYKEYSFGTIVFCEGMHVKENPYFNHLEVSPNKGHQIKVKLYKELEGKYTLKKKHFLFPVQGGKYYYGGTYDRDAVDSQIDECAIDQLRIGLSEFYPFPFEIVDKQFGFRPTVKDRRPILGRHPQHSNYFVFNGLGARGILNGCYFSKHLYEHIENGDPLFPEVDLKRFK